jgi:hypothetical protein
MLLEIQLLLGDWPAVLVPFLFKIAALSDRTIPAEAFVHMAP